ncbi:MAG: hypothetical protein JMDDDDMK_01660 [Acidobacteria bacterium]|nr:hypothetical protein [Acidobacteriota bacterium]
MIHQFRPRGRDFEFARYLHSQRVLEHRVAVEIVGEDDCALVAEFAVAIPIAPAAVAVIKVDTADAFDLLAACRNRVFDHQVLRARAVHAQPRHDQIARTQFARKRFDSPTRLAALVAHAQPQVFARQLQIVRGLRGEILLARVVIERRRGIEHARAALDHFHLIGVVDLAAFAFDDQRLTGGGFGGSHALRQHLLAVQENVNRVVGGKFLARLQVIGQRENGERGVLG